MSNSKSNGTGSTNAKGEGTSGKTEGVENENEHGPAWAGTRDKGSSLRQFTHDLHVVALHSAYVSTNSAGEEKLDEIIRPILRPLTLPGAASKYSGGGETRRREKRDGFLSLSPRLPCTRREDLLGATFNMNFGKLFRGSPGSGPEAFQSLKQGADLEVRFTDASRLCCHLTRSTPLIRVALTPE